MSYADAWSNAGCTPTGGNAAAYLTAVTDALNHVTHATYNSCTGSMASITDQNNQVTSYAYDLMGRITQINFPDGGRTSRTYFTSSFPFSVTTSKKLDAARNVVSQLFVDGLARTTQNILCEDGGSCSQQIKTDTTYDGLGRTSTVTNPYRTISDPTYGITKTLYDSLNRPCVIIPPDGTAVAGNSCPATQPSNDIFTTYAGNITTVTDQAGKKRKSVTDALGRLVQVFEDPAGLNYETDYQYSALNDLTSVVQAGSRQRTFAYDSLSRLTSATNPESGTITYKYDSDGACASPNSFPTLLVSKVDARGIRTCMQYETLNRVTQKSYSDGTGSVTFGYDDPNAWGRTLTNTIGRLVTIGTSDGQGEVFSYDPLGRLTRDEQCILWGLNGCGLATAAYNLDGSFNALNYPSGRKVTFAVDAASRPTGATLDSMNGTSIGYNYLGSATYPPNGAPATLVLGNGLTETSTYNKRLQPLNQQVASSVITPLYRSYSFYDSSSHNNGNVASITDNLAPGRTQNFTYDNLNRILTAKTLSTSGTDCWAQQFGYDAWGNLLTASPTQSGCPMTQLNVSVNTKNQIFNSGFSYDAAGNLLADGLNGYAFDGESRIKSFNSGAASYAYDGNGRRVAKQTGGVTTDYFYWGSEVIAEYNANNHDWSDYIYASGRRIARADTYEDGIQIQGTNSTTGIANTFAFPSAGGLQGYTQYKTETNSFSANLRTAWPAAVSTLAFQMVQ